MPSTQVRVGLNAVILAVTNDEPRVMTVPWSPQSKAIAADPGSGIVALPFGDLDADGDRTLELCLRRWVRQQTGLELGYVEQLYSFGDLVRDPQKTDVGVRVLSIAYLALVREEAIPVEISANWRNVYDFLPWEDWREGPPGCFSEISSVLDRCSAEVSDEKKLLRMQLTFGLHGVPWDGERVLERYELLWGMGWVQEAQQGRGFGKAMGLDHRRMLATALSRIRGKLRYRPVIFEMLPEEFTLLRLQKAVEALAGLPVHKQNFRRLVEQAGLVEGTGHRTGARGRPAELFRFRREVLRERPAPGVGLPRI